MRVVALILLLLPATAAAEFPYRNVQVLGHVNEYATPAPGQAYAYSACWSYIHDDGREYAVLGVSSGTAIYNVTTPSAPYRVGFFAGPPSIWREIKQFRDHLYVVTEGTGTGRGLQIIRMTDPEHPVLAATFTTPTLVSAHTVAVDTTRALLILNGTRSDNGVGGYPYQGMQIFSLANPEAPAQIAVWPATGPYDDTNYVHDCAPVGTRLYASLVYASTERVFDFSNPASPQLLSSWTYPSAFYTHNSWPDSTASALYVTDERNGQTLRVFDIRNLTQPVLVAGLSSNPKAIVHNAHVRRGELFLSNYTEGVRFLDLADPFHPAEFGWADSYSGPSGGYGGVWEVCPYFPSGIVVASDMFSGLWIYRPVRDYGSLKVRVIDADTGDPLAGVRVRLTTQGDSLITPGDGMVRFAPSPGTHTVVADLFGWTTASITRPVTTGSRDSVTLALSLEPTTSFSGVVRDRANGAPLDETDVALAYTALSTRSTARGDYLLSAVPEDDYQLEVHRPGYAPLVGERHIGLAFPNADFALSHATQWDSLETAGGWTVGDAGDNASGGVWVNAAPVGTGNPVAAPAAARLTEVATLDAAASLPAPFAMSPRPGASLDAPSSDCGTLARSASASAGACAGSLAFAGLTSVDGGSEPPTGHCGCGATCVCGVAPAAASSSPIKPWSDRTPGTATRCFVTGQAPSHTVNPDLYDLDGRTTLTSPPLDVTFAADPVIGYWHWFYSQDASTGQPDPNDWLAVLVSNDGGATWTSVDTLRGRNNTWQESSIHVKDFVTPTAQVRVRFVAADFGNASTTEAAVDDVILYDGPLAVNGVPEGGANSLHLTAPWPNPAQGPVHLSLAIPAATDVDVAIVDVHGRAVRRLHEGRVNGGPLLLVWDGRDGRGHRAAAGVYFAVARTAAATARARIVHLP